MPILRHWRIFELEGLDAAAEEARRRLAEHLDAARRGGDAGSRRRSRGSGVPRIASIG